jgi:hypothetical protein
MIEQRRADKNSPNEPGEPYAAPGLAQREEHARERQGQKDVAAPGDRLFVRPESLVDGVADLILARSSRSSMPCFQRSCWMSSISTGLSAGQFPFASLGFDAMIFPSRSDLRK